MPEGKTIAQGGNPERYYNDKPAWSFATVDTSKWAFSEEHIGDVLWSEIMPKLKGFESQTWNEILQMHKKQNHSINPSLLNKVAQDRLVELHIEAESIISLRFTGNHRLYGYMSGRVFNILWYDDDHGDNTTCVCRSRKKGT